MLDAPDDVANAASQAGLAVAHTFLMNVAAQTGGLPSRNTKVADTESSMEVKKRLNSLSDPYALPLPFKLTPSWTKK